jgi:hypothetical protein
VKPIITDLDVVELEKDVKNPLKLAWKGLVAGLFQLFKNHPKDQFATRVPFSGRFENPEAATWPTIGNVLWNAFIQALPSKLENSVGLGDARREQADQKGDAPADD